MAAVDIRLIRKGFLLKTGRNAQLFDLLTNQNAQLFHINILRIEIIFDSYNRSRYNSQQRREQQTKRARRARWPLSSFQYP
jgi:hypothetical protein